MQSLTCAARRLAFAGLLTAGCATTGLATALAASPAPAASPSSAAADTASAVEPSVRMLAPNFIPVSRYGRYTLVELMPEPAQRDLMQQVIEVSVPPSLDATVGEGLRYILLRTGYRLCESTDAAVLYTLPLPAAHLHLGPLSLRDALLTIAGPAWDLFIDDVERQVCFRRDPATHPASTSAASVDAPASAANAPQPVAPTEEARP